MIKEIIYTLEEVNDEVYGNKRCQADSNDLSEFKNDVAADNPHGNVIIVNPMIMYCGGAQRVERLYPNRLQIARWRQ